MAIRVHNGDAGTELAEREDKIMKWLLTAGLAGGYLPNTSDVFEGTYDEAAERFREEVIFQTEGDCEEDGTGLPGCDCRPCRSYRLVMHPGFVPDFALDREAYVSTSEHHYVEIVPADE